MQCVHFCERGEKWLYSSSSRSLAKPEISPYHPECINKTKSSLWLSLTSALAVPGILSAKADKMPEVSLFLDRSFYMKQFLTQAKYRVHDLQSSTRLFCGTTCSDHSADTCVQPMFKLSTHQTAGSSGPLLIGPQDLVGCSTPGPAIG